MHQTIEATIDRNGIVILRENVRLVHARRALVTILDDPLEDFIDETALLSEAALAEDWNRPEEDEAWAYLQPVRS